MCTKARVITRTWTTLSPERAGIVQHLQEVSSGRGRSPDCAGPLGRGGKGAAVTLNKRKVTPAIRSLLFFLLLPKLLVFATTGVSPARLAGKACSTRAHRNLKLFRGSDCGYSNSGTLPVHCGVWNSALARTRCSVLMRCYLLYCSWSLFCALTVPAY